MMQVFLNTTGKILFLMLLTHKKQGENKTLQLQLTVFAGQCYAYFALKKLRFLGTNVPQNVCITTKD